MPKRRVVASSSAVHPIQVVARRTGLSMDVIRAWEKRYAVVTPLRTDNGRRLYSDADVDRLRLLAQATNTGRSIKQVAGLTGAELEAAVREPADRQSAASAGSPAAEQRTDAAPMSVDHLQLALDAVERFDALALDAALRRAVIALPAEQFLDSVVVPLWQRVTDRMRENTLRPPHGHLTLTTLRRTLHRIAEVGIMPFAAPDLVVTTPAGQPHELGALLAAAAAAAEGWRVTYVGPGVPADEIAETATYARARAVAVSLGTLRGDRILARELRRLRALLPHDVPILVECDASVAHGAALREIGATMVPDLPTLRTRLRAVRTG
jgi:DNA-binding transcriptional MerR regulator/methylmalonyl-CoA mutase cobalamin-binding subunit